MHLRQGYVCMLPSSAPALTSAGLYWVHFQLIRPAGLNRIQFHFEIERCLVYNRDFKKELKVKNGVGIGIFVG